MIAELGGRELVMDDPSKLEWAAEKIVRGTVLENREKINATREAPTKPGARAGDQLKEANLRTAPVKKVVEPGPDRTGPRIINPSLRHALSTSLDTLLEENVEIYALKLQEQTRQIRDALDASTQRILRRFDSGPHERILDPVNFASEFRHHLVALMLQLLLRKFVRFGEI
jgi:hypothetical protein